MARLVAYHSYDEIAELLGISSRTVKAYADGARFKLQCRNKRELARYVEEHSEG